MIAVQPTEVEVQAAANTIKAGGVVVLPTETVYGLACDALNREAVMRVFRIKGRPADNPLIVHIADASQLAEVAESWSDACLRLAERFWPGPLTLVLPKNPIVPEETTAGLDTVAVRVPSHPIALAVIQASGRPIAAPSANLFTGLSPTSVNAVDPAIAHAADLVLDGGPCEIGLESTVLDLSGEHPHILRPGAVSRGDIEAVLGRPLGSLPPPQARRSPGMYLRHYAPKTKVRLVDELGSSDAGLTFRPAATGRQIRMPLDARAYGANLYSALKSLDDLGVKEILVARPPESSDWEAVHDRLRKASAT